MIERCEGQMSEGQDSNEYKGQGQCQSQDEGQCKQFARRPLIKEHLQ